ncbi:hypothetical protein ACTFIT_001972 [Dictyostelium discoideum]
MGIKYSIIFKFFIKAIKWCNFKGNFKGNFKEHYKVNFKGHFKGNFKEHYKGNFKGHFKGNFQGHFKVNFKGDFKGNFKGNFKGDFKGDFKEIYNVGDAVEVASDNELSGRWSGIINSISMIEMDDNIIKHAILLNYFDKYVGDQFNKYHFLSNELNYITYDNILNNVIPIQIDDTNYLIIYKCHDKFSASKNKKSKN